MRIGYACLTVGVVHTEQKRCILKNASESKLIELIAHNLDSLEKIINYNIENNIKLFRISSDLIPFGSNPVNTLAWWERFEPKLTQIGEKIRKGGMRVSMHPGQYTVLNSPDQNVVNRAIEDLNYHARVLRSLGMGTDHKIVLHVGGIYNQKSAAIQRFIAQYQRLDESVKQRLALENDDKLYHIADVLEIAHHIQVPVIFDNLHHAVNPPYDAAERFTSNQEKCNLMWINDCANTWKQKDGKQKIHYSQQDQHKRPGAHSSSIKIDEFMAFYQALQEGASQDLDIMLEVKDKNLSAVKCINCTMENPAIQVLQIEWSRYKYKVLENAPSTYRNINQLLSGDTENIAVPFYRLIEGALQVEGAVADAVHTAQYLWGLLKDKVTEKEAVYFSKRIKAYKQGEIGIDIVKKSIWKIAKRHKERELLDSYYFVL